jgi:hypothetical protein
MKLGNGRTVEMARPEAFNFKPRGSEFNVGKSAQALVSVFRDWGIRVCLQMMYFGLEVVNSFFTNFTNGGVGTF